MQRYKERGAKQNDLSKKHFPLTTRTPLQEPCHNLFVLQTTIPPIWLKRAKPPVCFNHIDGIVVFYFQVTAITLSFILHYDIRPMILLDNRSAKAIHSVRQMVAPFKEEPPKRLGFSLTHTHASLNNIDHIVAKLFTFVDDIHIHGTNGVCVFVLVDIVDVLSFKLIAVVVDLVFDVE